MLGVASQNLRAAENLNMALSKKVNQLQVEHVSEEEVDQLFFALEQKEKQLVDMQAEKDNLEAEVLTARQLTARGGNVVQVQQTIEVHHHHEPDSDDSDDDDARPAAAPEAAAP